MAATRWMRLGMIGILFCGTVCRGDWRDEMAATMRAIEHLGAVYGGAFPAVDYSARLAALEAKLREPSQHPEAGAAFEALRKQALIDGCPLSRHGMLFVVRQQYRPDHHNTATFFPAAAQEYNDGQFTPGGALKAIDFAHGGKVRTLIETAHGVIRDPEVHFDGQRIVFSMRTNAADSYHIYEIGVDGTGLRQLTFGRDVDDLDPLYLPDDSIVFSSTREPKYCMCNRHIMANLYRMEGNGANIHQIGKSTLFEGHAALMPDGRILYDRWEYVDRNFGDAQGLWTANPDGTSHSVFWGNNTASPGAVIDARIVPGSGLALCVFGSCHDRPWGALALVDRSRGLDGATAVIRTWPANATNLIRQTGWEQFDLFTKVPLKYEDPWPINETQFLASRMTGAGEQMGIYLLDLFGNELLLHAEKPGCFDPMPLGPRQRPPVISNRRDFAARTGTFYVQDVYEGTHMKGVKRGAAKWLRVVESPEKRFWSRPVWNGQGIEGPAMNWHDFNNKRILGTVPVEADGSAYFTVPAERFVYFQLLDERGMMIQSMRSGVMVQPGETAACIGCHEERRSAPATRMASTSSYRPKGAPRALEPWYGPEREFSFRREVQPVLEKHCVRCHDYGTEGGKTLLLAGDRDLVFNTAYNELWRKKMIRVVGAGPSDTQQAYSWGSHAGKLGQTLLKNWHSKLSREEYDRVVTWIDLNAPYYPSYACAYPDNLAGRSPLDDRQLGRLEALTKMPMRAWSGHGNNQGPQVSFDRPELSPCLQKITDKSSPEYREALEIIRAGAAMLAGRPEADADGFKPNPVDQWREQKYQARRIAEARQREAIREGRKYVESAADTGAPTGGQ